ncbi:MAG: transcriptional regulator [Candidatus Saccharimonas sp.]
MIDALFGSKTRVKLLNLFMNNPGKAFYVREITRLIDEQINSVRRELANMLSIGVITSSNTDNKLYYEVNQRYEFYIAFREIFAATKQSARKTGGKLKSSSMHHDVDWQGVLKSVHGLRVAIAAGVLVEGSVAKVDLLLAGSVPERKIKEIIGQVESAFGREITYSVMTYDEFYYRMSVKDKFIYDALTNKHMVIFDSDSIIG